MYNIVHVQIIGVPYSLSSNSELNLCLHAIPIPTLLKYKYHYD